MANRNAQIDTDRALGLLSRMVATLEMFGVATQEAFCQYSVWELSPRLQPEREETEPAATSSVRFEYNSAD